MDSLRCIFNVTGPPILPKTFPDPRPSPGPDSTSETSPKIFGNFRAPPCAHLCSSADGVGSVLTRHTGFLSLYPQCYGTSNITENLPRPPTPPLALTTLQRPPQRFSVISGRLHVLISRWRGICLDLTQWIPFNVSSMLRDLQYTENLPRPPPQSWP